MRKILASAVGASLLGAGALGMAPLGMTAGIAQAAERPASTPAEAPQGPTLLGSLLDTARATIATAVARGDLNADRGDVTGTAGDQNGNDRGDVTGTAGDVTGTGHEDRGTRGGGSDLSGTLTAIAGVIGIPEADLVAALESGQSLAGIAGAHNVDPQKVIDALVAAARSKLDAGVAAGFLTRPQEDQILPLITGMITRLVNATPPVLGHNDGGGGGNPTATAA